MPAPRQSDYRHTRVAKWSREAGMDDRVYHAIYAVLLSALIVVLTLGYHR
ncbi:hypothetical protein AB0F42_06220 [Streptomyces buecherae]